MTGDSGGGDSGRENIVGNSAAVLQFDAKSKSSKIEVPCDETLGIPPIQCAKFRLSTKGNCRNSYKKVIGRPSLPRIHYCTEWRTPNLRKHAPHCQERPDAVGMLRRGRR